MALIFADGFDNYGSGLYPGAVTDFWDSNSNDTNINVTLGVPRTGRGCLQIHSAAFGPTKMLPAHFTHVMFCTAWNSSSLGNVMDFMLGKHPIVRVLANANGSLSFTTSPIDPGPTVTTAAGFVHFN